MATSTNTTIPWSEIFSSASSISFLFSHCKEAILASYNVSSHQTRQALRELTLLLLLSEENEEIEALLTHVERNCFFLDDPRSQLYITIMHTLLGHSKENTLYEELLTTPSLESIEYAFLLVVLGSLIESIELQTKGTSYLHTITHLASEYPKSVGVDFVEYQLITPEGVLASFYKKKPLDYPGKEENLYLLRILSEKIQTIPQVKPMQLMGVCIEKMAGGTCIESMQGNHTGFFSFMKNDLGILSMGPSFFPLCDEQTFGIIGEGSQKQCAAFQKTFQKGKVDIGWLHWAKNIVQDVLHITIYSVASEEMYPFALCLLLKGAEITIEGGITLYPRSLNKYQSEAKQLWCSDKNKNFNIYPIHTGEMQVIPLAGKEYFLGADFLLAFILEDEREKITLKIK